MMNSMFHFEARRFLLALAAGALVTASACREEPSLSPYQPKPAPTAGKEGGQAAAPAAPAYAGDGGPLDGSKLFTTKTCVACHGKDAKTPILPNYPRLAGQSAAYAEQQMKDIKSGARSNGQTAAMKGIMPLVNDDEIHALAEYLSTLR